MMAKFAKLSRQMGTQQVPTKRTGKENSNPNLQGQLLFLQMGSYKLQQGILECLKQLFPLREVIADVEQPDPLVVRVVGPSATAGADSSCAVVVGHFGSAVEHMNSGGKRKESPTQSVESTGKVNPEAPGWTRRFRIGRAPPDRAPCPL